MQTAVQQDTASTGLFRTLNLSAPLTFDSATTLRQVLKEATQYACLSRPERAVCMEMIDSLDQLLTRFTGDNPR